jgi:hypothetical protein
MVPGNASGWGLVFMILIVILEMWQNESRLLLFRAAVKML